MPVTTTTAGGEIRVHHSRCGNPERLGCRCPPSWPRRPEDVLLMHRWSGNCFRLPSAGEACEIHGEPRGACSRCGRCAACEAGAAANSTR